VNRYGPNPVENEARANDLAANITKEQALDYSAKAHDLLVAALQKNSPLLSPNNSLLDLCQLLYDHAEELPAFQPSEPCPDCENGCCDVEQN
jgi:hypothetical protein